jgi:hypothetical protein
MTTSSSNCDSIPLTPEHSPARPKPVEYKWERRYERVGDLGSGGQARVFAARDRSTNNTVAIKVPNDDDESLRRFRREIDELRKCRHHNVMPLLDAGEGWYAMPTAEGSLRGLAMRLGDEERLALVDDVAAGLSHAHGLLLVHRDVTPGNILRLSDENGRRWVIADFGLLRRAPGESSEPRTRGWLGTAGFAAPEMEILGAHEVDHRADIYSFGATIAFMVSGRWPNELAEVTMPSPWRALIDGMMKRERPERMQSMALVRDYLDGVRESIFRHREATWRLAGGLELKDHEVKLLGLILDAGGTAVRLGALRESTILSTRELALAEMTLRSRGLLADWKNDHGEVWGVELTKQGVAWVQANEERLLANQQVAKVPTPISDLPF